MNRTTKILLIHETDIPQLGNILKLYSNNYIIIIYDKNRPKTNTDLHYHNIEIEYHKNDYNEINAALTTYLNTHNYKVQSTVIAVFTNTAIDYLYPKLSLTYIVFKYYINNTIDTNYSDFTEIIASQDENTLCENSNSNNFLIYT